jgi:hypothetical protein
VFLPRVFARCWAKSLLHESQRRDPIFVVFPDRDAFQCFLHVWCYDFDVMEIHEPCEVPANPLYWMHR